MQIGGPCAIVRIVAASQMCLYARSTAIASYLFKLKIVFVPIENVFVWVTKMYFIQIAKCICAIAWSVAESQMCLYAPRSPVQLTFGFNTAANTISLEASTKNTT